MANIQVFLSMFYQCVHKTMAILNKKYNLDELL